MKLNKNTASLNRLGLICFAGALFFIASLHAQKVIAHSQKWASEQSDLPKDPAVHYGRLENGFKYAWSKKTEKDSCLLRLMVHTGSLHEREDERGIAHFLEHLAFDGSKNFPDGTLRSYFQEMGVKHGPHLNAHTDFDETVYEINLPQCTPERLSQALTAFRDFADGLLLKESEIEKERGIIDMEDQKRDSKDLRIYRKIMSEFYKGTIYAQRLPIGEKNIRKTFDRKKIHEFYKRWYRPDNMTLILVGDFGQTGPEDQIRDIFASLQKDSEEFPVAPDRGSLNPEHKETIISETDSPFVKISFLSTEQQEKREFTKEYFFRQNKLLLVGSLYQYKISQYLSEHKKDFHHISLVNDVDFDIMQNGIRFILNKDRWTEGLLQATLLHNEIISCGFNSHDRTIVLREIETLLKNMAEREDAENVLNGLLNDARQQAPRLDPESLVSLYREFLQTLTLQELNHTLRDLFNHDKTFSSNLLVIGDFSEKEDRLLTEQIREVVTEGLKTRVSCTKSETPEFGYKSAAPEKVEEYKHIINTDFDYHSIEFRNGVIAHLKKNTDPERPGTILIHAKIGHGLWEFDASDKVLIELGSSNLILGGTRKHPFIQFRDLTAGKDISFHFTTTNYDSSFSGRSSPDDFLHYLEWNRAYIDDPAFGSASIPKAKDHKTQWLKNITNTFYEPFYHDFRKYLYDDDFSPLTETQINNTKETEIIAWMKENLLNRCPEFTIVGDIDTEQAIQHLYQTFGDLTCKRMPAKDEIRAEKSHRKSGVHREYHIDSEDPTALVGFTWPVHSVPGNLRSVIENIIDQRITASIREDLNITYTPQVSLNISPDPWEDNYLEIKIITDPQQTSTVLEITPKIVASFLEQPVNEAELNQARNPVAEQLKLAKTSSSFWLNQIPVRKGYFSSYEEGLQHLLSRNHEQLNTIILDMLSPDKYSSIVIKPEQKIRGSQVQLTPACE
ncbi:MAG: insulinase family protein [Deltaproteobacteria bacterium]|nr:insulinase family protein [Deltaproteobacteria bacterium]